MPQGAMPDEMFDNAETAASYLKALAHKGRLMILCHLSQGEKSVGELEDLLDARQAAVSQLLARLREDTLVQSRRDGKTIYYSLADNDAVDILAVLYRKFCA